jgi:hypothetical protein
VLLCLDMSGRAKSARRVNLVVRGVDPRPVRRVCLEDWSVVVLIVVEWRLGAVAGLYESDVLGSVVDY